MGRAGPAVRAEAEGPGKTSLCYLGGPAPTPSHHSSVPTTPLILLPPPPPPGPVSVEEETEALGGSRKATVGSLAKVGKHYFLHPQVRYLIHGQAILPKT